ncbi:potassium-transporting ATPase subunit KdpA, partial [Streptomyces clavuligerus]
MNATLAGWLQILALVAALALSHRPLGDHIARCLTDGRHLRAERVVHRAAGVPPDADQTWPAYLRSVLAFSLVSLALLYVLLRAQHLLPLSLGRPGVPPDLSFNTAVSFVTNTDWQAYAGERTLGHLVQMAGLTVQNFLSAAVGIAVAAALVRGFTRERSERVGHFWTDLTRLVVRVLLPIAFLFALVLAAGGVVQNLHGDQSLSTVAGGLQTLPGGPVASQESIKLLGTNGGGFYNANSAHPFENPTALTHLIEVYLLLVVPVALPRTFGTLVGDRRQGRAVLAVMALIWAVSVAVVTANEVLGVSSTAGREAGAML